MRIFILPVYVHDIWNKMMPGNELVYLYRQGENPCLFMHHVTADLKENCVSYDNGSEELLKIHGDLVEGRSFEELKDGDHLYVLMNKHRHTPCNPIVVELYPNMDMMFPFPSERNILAIAAGLEQAVSIYITSGDEAETMVARAQQVVDKARKIYFQYPAYQHIMLKRGDEIESKSLVKLASEQTEKKQAGLTALILAYQDKRASTKIPDRVLEQCEFDESFSLMTQEEQVGTFIEFSKKATTKKQEYVSDDLIDKIKQSPEYEKVKADLSANGLGISKTQQFNVFQQVGYFSTNQTTNILYNLSDMGAGKTLMTVEAIYLLDLKQMSTWKRRKDRITEHLEICGLTLPDKHIIAPTLSVKSSWIDTFRLFYEVEEINEMTYRLTANYDGMTATSMIYVSSFTVKDGKIFAKDPLPHMEQWAYLIIDEIHQLVSRKVSRTKFFPPKTDPRETYKTFILSGTMSNLKTEQWYNYMRFIGLPVCNGSVQDAVKQKDRRKEWYVDSIEEASKNIRTDQHRYFDTEDITEENYYRYEGGKKKTSVEENFFTQYGTQILVPFRMNGGESIPVEDLLTRNGCSYGIEVDPAEADNINFELFYNIVGSKAVTAQSMQIAEELFGEQKKQHVSDIIKTVSPLSKEDIHILKVLHHIAEDHNQYKSATIAKNINNAILNLNDGLQTKNIYDIVSGYAEKNLRFFEYLSTLDVNILEELPKSGLIKLPKLEDTDKFKVLQDILRREKDETHLIVVNDYYALKALSDALGIEHLTKEQLKKELDYQEVLDNLFEKQSIVIVTQDMIKSSLDLVQANRLIQYQLNTEISDIIQTQNRINRIGQTRETRGYYIASDQLQENLIELFLESYRNIRVAHKGIVELFADITSQINVVNDYLEKAFRAIDENENYEPEVEENEEELEDPLADTELMTRNSLPEGASINQENGICKAILYPQNGTVIVLVPLETGNAFPLGILDTEKAKILGLQVMATVSWNLITNKIEE